MRNGSYQCHVVFRVGTTLRPSLVCDRGSGPLTYRLAGPPVTQLVMGSKLGRTAGGLDFCRVCKRVV